MAQELRPDDPTAAPGTAEAAPKLRRLPTPSLGFYGVPGLIDMPTGETVPDGQVSVGLSWFGGVGRYTASFQLTPWLSGSFRYNSIAGLGLFGFDTFYDRNFDVRFRLLKETARRPGLVLGLQDFAGTGINAGEYIVATKTFALPPSRFGRNGQLKITGGLGWGRLGSYGSIGQTGERPTGGGTGGINGGQLAYDTWFRGPFAPFGGIEWRPNDRWGLKVEYSTDAYELETQTSDVFDRRSPISFGVEYQAAPTVRLGGYFVYGSEIGFSAQFQPQPRVPVVPVVAAAPLPIVPRPARATNPDAWGTGWATSTQAPVQLRDVLIQVLEPQGVELLTLSVQATSAEVRYQNTRYRVEPVAIGRVARALAQVMPASVETFHIIPTSAGMALSRVTVRRSDLEALEFDADASDAIKAVTGVSEAPPLPADAVANEDAFPVFSYFFQPYLEPGYFDPDSPIRADVGLEARAIWRPAPGWTASGALRYRLFGNLEDGRPSNSRLEPVRTNQVEYAQFDFTMRDLFVSKQWRAGRDLYARATVGYLEQMFGGLSTELLWKPVTSSLALGVEANYVRQRNFDQGFGFQDYTVFTGHASGYYELGSGLVAQINAGRYLAGDIGATFGLDRTFNNGWSVGAFFTLTDVSAEDFGEGSFDKGIRFSIPLGWFTGTPSRQSVGTTILPVQRDGGQRLRVPGRLYGQVRAAHRKALSEQSVRFWE